MLLVFLPLRREQVRACGKRAYQLGLSFILMMNDEVVQAPYLPVNLLMWLPAVSAEEITSMDTITGSLVAP